MLSDSGSEDEDSAHSDWTPSVEREHKGTVMARKSKRKIVQPSVTDRSVTDQSSSGSESDSDFNPRPNRAKKRKQNNASTSSENGNRNRNVSSCSDGTFDYCDMSYQAICYSPT